MFIFPAFICISIYNIINNICYIQTNVCYMCTIYFTLVHIWSCHSFSYTSTGNAQHLLSRRSF